MKALFRIVLAAVGVLGLLAVAVVIYATTFLDPNDLKPRLVEAVRDRTGLELSLDGPLSWTFYPRLGLTVEDASARMPGQSASETPFAALERSDARIRFAPLLAGNIEVDGFTLEGLRLYLARDENGQANWTRLAETLARHHNEAPATRTTASGPQQVTSAGDRPLAMNVANVEVIDGQVHYVDRAQGRSLMLDNLALEATGVNTETPFPVSAAFRFDATGPTGSGQVSLSTRAALDPAADEWALEGVALEGSLRPSQGDDARDRRFTLDVERLSAEQGAGQYRLAGGVLSTSLEPAALDGEALPLSAEFAATLDVREGSVLIEPLRITSDDQLRLDASARIEGIGDDPLWQGQLEMAPTDWRPWLDQRGLLPVTADVEALTRTGFTARFEGDSERTYFEPLTLELDDARLEGRMALGFATPLLHLALEGERLDLDRYLPPMTETSPEGSDAPEGEREASDAEERAAQARGENASESESASEETASEGAPEDDVTENGASEGVEGGAPGALLRHLDLELALTLEALKARQLQFAPFAAEVSGTAGRFELEALEAGLYDGSLSTTGSLDARINPMALTLSPQLEGVALSPLLKALFERETPLRGSLGSEGTFSARLGGGASPLETLSGQGRFVITDGALVGLDLPARVCHATAMLQGREPSEEQAGTTAIERLEGRVVIEGGVIRSDELDVAIPGMVLDASGEIDLVRQQLDIETGASLVDTTAIDGCSVSETLSGLRLPLRCTGALDATPAQWCRLDDNALKALLRSSALDGGGERLEAEVERYLDESLGEEEGRSLRNTIRGLFE